MAFVEQQDVFNAVQPVIYNVFQRDAKKVCEDFVKITFKDAMLKYGTDKPGLGYDLFIEHY